MLWIFFGVILMILGCCWRGMMAANDAESVRRAMRLGELAAIRSEEYAAAHPAEIARRRRFFRRLLEECYFKGGEQKV